MLSVFISMIIMMMVSLFLLTVLYPTPKVCVDGSEHSVFSIAKDDLVRLGQDEDR